MTTAASSSSIEGDSVGISAAGITVRVAVALLFVAFVSGVDEATDAVFETEPAVAGSVTTSEIVAAAPLAIVPSAHVTVDVPLQLP